MTWHCQIDPRRAWWVPTSLVQNFATDWDASHSSR